MVPGLDKLENSNLDKLSQIKDSQKSPSVFNSTDGDIDVHSKIMSFASKQLSKDTDIISNVSLNDISVYLNSPAGGSNKQVESVLDEIIKYFSHFFNHKLSTKYGASYLEIMNCFNKFKSNDCIMKITGNNDADRISVRIECIYHYILDIIITKRRV